MPQVRVIAAAIAAPFFAQADEPKPFHFAHDISPLLVKQACASAECWRHGNSGLDFRPSCVTVS